TIPAATPDGLALARPPDAVPDKNLVSVGQPAADPSQKASMVPQKRSRSGAIRAVGKTVRLRDKDHRKFVQQQACLVCGRAPSDPHHLTFTQPRALGRRVSDEFTVPVCRIHHRELHRFGDEESWWQKLNIDPLTVALRLWQHTHGNVAQINEVTTQANAATKPDISAQDGAEHGP